MTPSRGEVLKSQAKAAESRASAPVKDESTRKSQASSTKLDNSAQVKKKTQAESTKPSPAKATKSTPSKSTKLTPKSTKSSHAKFEGSQDGSELLHDSSEDYKVREDTEEDGGAEQAGESVEDEKAEENEEDEEAEEEEVFPNSSPKRKAQKTPLSALAAKGRKMAREEVERSPSPAPRKRKVAKKEVERSPSPSPAPRKASGSSSKGKKAAKKAPTRVQVWRFQEPLDGRRYEAVKKALRDSGVPPGTKNTTAQLIAKLETHVNSKLEIYGSNPGGLNWGDIVWE